MMPSQVNRSSQSSSRSERALSDDLFPGLSSDSGGGNGSDAIVAGHAQNEPAPAAGVVIGTLSADKALSADKKALNESEESFSDDKNHAQKSYQAIYRKGLTYLSRREYSRYELMQKLQRHGSREVIEKALQALRENGYQSDERFAESLCNGRRNRGYGPNYIANELQSRGIASETASATLAAYEGSWFELAVAAVDKKYMRDIEAWSRAEESAQIEGDRGARQVSQGNRRKLSVKISQFLARRGFPGDIIRNAADKFFD